MDNEKKLRAYSALADNTKKWVTAMDAKAAFISTLNAGLLTFIWTGAKLEEDKCYAYYIGLLATFASLGSLFLALRVILPKSSLKSIFGKNITYVSGYKPISFYGFVAENFPKDKHSEFITHIQAMDEGALATEALEQHYTISHVVNKKAKLLIFAGYIFKFALILAVTALVVKKAFPN